MSAQDILARALRVKHLKDREILSRGRNIAVFYHPSRDTAVVVRNERLDERWRDSAQNGNFFDFFVTDDGLIDVTQGDEVEYIHDCKIESDGWCVCQAGPF